MLYFKSSHGKSPSNKQRDERETGDGRATCGKSEIACRINQQAPVKGKASIYTNGCCRLTIFDLVDY